jgi:hypothetical protein
VSCDADNASGFLVDADGRADSSTAQPAAAIGIAPSARL